MTTGAVTISRRPDTPDWLRAARIAVATVRTGLDRDDAMQIASLAAWQAAARWNPDGGTTLVTWCVTRAKGALVDELRSRTGRKSGRQARRYQTIHLTEGIDFAVDDPEPSDLSRLIDQLATTDTERRTCAALASGATKTELAHREGVQPSAISVRLRGIRDRSTYPPLGA